MEILLYCMQVVVEQIICVLFSQKTKAQVQENQRLEHSYNLTT